MQIRTRRRLRHISTALVLYLILWIFLWCFLLVNARSYNRLSHEPVAMAQLTIQSDGAELALADYRTDWNFPTLSGDWCFWMGTLPGTATDLALCTWQYLWTYWQ